MTGLVVRDDLTQRKALSKSALAQFDLCQTKTWFGIHDPRPFIPNEKVVFGSAVDAAVEQLVGFAAIGAEPDMDRAWRAADEVQVRDGIALELTALHRAVTGFRDDVMPKFDWLGARTQTHLHVTFEDLGESDGHPDIILGDGSIFDVKTSARAKDIPSVELTFYALMREEEGDAVPRVGYLNYVRIKNPYWQMVEYVPTPEDRRQTRAIAMSYVRARRLDELVSKTQHDYRTMNGGPRFDSLCSDCPYNPALGGSCDIARRGVLDDVA